jgi:hypothetical protein
MGMSDFFDEFIEDYIRHLSLVMSKDMEDVIDDHHTFIVEYSSLGKDKELSFHVDDSELTLRKLLLTILRLNCCLGKNFIGGNLFFMGKENEPLSNDDYCEIEHSIGTCILHGSSLVLLTLFRWKTQVREIQDSIGRHGALEIEKGERYNLIIWCRSSKYRNK